MSTSYQIVCEDCKELLYMGDFRAGTNYFFGHPTKDTYEAIYAIDDDELKTFDAVFIRSVLHILVFHRQHYGHKVKVVSEYDPIWDTDNGAGYYGNSEDLGYKKIHEPLLYDNEVREFREQQRKSNFHGNRDE